MNHTKFLPNDPKLTAYALGELEGFERAAVEAALRDDPAARAAVEEIRALGLQLEGAFAAEAKEELTKDKTATASASSGNGRAKSRPSPLAQLIKFPQFYYVAGCAAAACFALMVALRTPRPMPPQPFETKITFVPAPVALPAAEPAAPVDAEKNADTAASAGVTLSLSPLVANQPVTAQTPVSMLSQDLSLVGQAKDQAAAPKLAGGGDLSLAVAPAERDLKKETLGNLTRVEPLVIDTGRAAAGARGDVSQVSPIAPAAKSAVEKAVADARKQREAQLAPALTSSGGEVATLSAFSVTGSTVGGAVGGASFSYAGGGGGANTRAWANVTGNEFNTLTLRAVNGGGRLASTDRYADAKDNEFLGAAQNRLSTFSIDVDTASYSNVRGFLQRHQRPPRDAVRIEELVNYFPYRYAPPMAKVAAVSVAKRDDGVTSSVSKESAAPFAASLEVADAPWAPEHRLVRIGLKGREVSSAARPAANLVFLLDVSGSMNAPNRLPLVKESMRLLVGKLRPDDRVAIVTYAGNSGLALASTPVSHAREILDALDSLSPGGSTNGGMGIKLAYDIAKANFTTGGINRVILCTDGDFNVGVTSEGELTRLIEEKAKTGVALTALGFGMGNLKDATLEKLADHGNGNYGYIDSRREAEKLLVEQVNGTLLTIAKDVKIQVEFNPARVASYRLIGYENRMLKKEDFNNDTVDAGEIGAGHTVTAFYEIVPVGVEDKSGAATAEVDELKYRIAETGNRKEKASADPVSNELLTVKMRYKEPASETSRKLEFPLTDSGAKFADASTDFKFAAAVASFGMILRESPYKGSATLNDVVAWAESGSTDDAGGYRAEFIDLAREAEKLER